MTDLPFLAPGEQVTPENAPEILVALRASRPRVAHQWINHEGEHVWIKQVTKEQCAAAFVGAGIDPEKAYGYVTDCCFVDDPCAQHAQANNEDRP